ncbi:MAG: TolC family protein [Candidatus Omnitrophica bacterium]|nr:TolC family protein [Candidatus Omnitrophota bacterium]
MSRLFRIFTLISILFVSGEMSAHAQTQDEILSFERFLELAAINDKEFEQILIDELTLKYQKRLKLPAKDLVLSLKQQHEFYLSQDRQSPDTTVGLTKLFPLSGTEIAVDYQVGASLASRNKSSELSFTIAQPIAENAFGRSTQLLDKIVGLEVDVASHQVVEAYEDYLASIILAYYTWHEDYENLLIGKASYNQNVKLLDSMNEREKQKIALPIDVNKVRLQVLSKKERLTELEEEYKNSLNIIQRIIRSQEKVVYVPQPTEPMILVSESFEDVFKSFMDLSRTFDIIKKLEDKSSLEVDRDADDLLPSINIIAGYEMSGDDYAVKNDDDFLFAGITMEWPFPNQVARAEYEVSKIMNKKQKFSTVNTYYRLYTQLMNLYLQIEREVKLIDIAEERIKLAKSILDDEGKNYSFGKVTLNDYIQAFNNLDTTRFNKIAHDSQYRKLLVEWLRLNDKLVNKSEITAKLNKLKTEVK